ncbi:MAG: glycosyltransferase family 1 protein [Pseudomonadota bacterium]
MKIAVDCRMIRHSGIGVVLGELLPRLIQSDHEFHLIGGEPLPAEYATERSSLHPFDAPIYSIREQVRYPVRLLETADVLLFPHYNVPLRRPAPMVVIIHDLAPLALPLLFKGPAKRLYANFFFRAVLKTAERIITVSQFTKQEIVTRLGANPDKITVIRNGPGRTYPSDADLSRGRLRRYGIEGPYVLTVGNLKPHKNIPRLIEAVRLLNLRRIEPVRLVAAGKVFNQRTDSGVQGGDWSEDAASGGLLMAGYVPDEDMPALYHNAALFVMPSMYEGFGLPPLEALRYDTLPLVADAGGLREVIDIPALRFDPYEIEQMARRIEFYLNNPGEAQALLNAAKESARRFSWDRAAQSYLAVLEEVGYRRAEKSS